MIEENLNEELLKETSVGNKVEAPVIETKAVEVKATPAKAEKKEILEITEIYHKYHNEVIQNGDLYSVSQYDYY